MAEAFAAEAASGRTMGPAPAPAPLIALGSITKAFGETLANAEIDLEIGAGDVIGLVGGNGAGKSTLMRILSGGLPPTLGHIAVDGRDISLAGYDTAAAQRLGIRMVHQELSLCTNLSVAENFFIEVPGGSTWTDPRWRARHRARARAALEAVFPGSSIDVDARVGSLAIGERQMVEIARATAAPGVRLVILDEPTSSLDLERSRQLRAFMHSKAADGLAFIFISHKLQEVVDIASRVIVMRNGRIAWAGAAGESSVDMLVELMGGRTGLQHEHAGAGLPDARTSITIGGRFTARLGRQVHIHEGEIVGLAGLEGSGQKQLLHAIFGAGRKAGEGITRHAAASFIAGDRQKEGVFPLWSVLDNIGIGRIARLGLTSLVSMKREAELAAGPAERLRLDAARFASRIGELSGGNQQKALVARALVAGQPIMLLDDPTRGVDIATKQDFYALCQQAAAEGKTLVWQTTEDAELSACDRVLVFAGGEIVAELAGSQITAEALVAASFAHVGGNTARERRAPAGRLARNLVNIAPYAGLALVLAIMISVNPMVGSIFGLDLLLLPALSLVLVAIAQMYVVGGSEIDLGVGAFAGLVSVLAATLLFDTPALGLAAIAAAIAAYSGLGWLIQARRIPAIVVTLGASFIWGGIGLSIQPTPGGQSPDWLSALVNWSSPFVPTSVVLIAAVAAIALVLDRMPLGVVLRGFGNNPAAMRASGWSPTRFAIIRYLIAGLFAAVAGLSLTAINTASDINSGNSYTLLSVAAVVMGGCALIGGTTAPVGVVVGAVTLSLIGALLGMLSISSDYNAAMQGLVLIALLAMRSLVARSETEE